MHESIKNGKDELADKLKNMGLDVGLEFTLMPTGDNTVFVLKGTAQKLEEAKKYFELIKNISHENILKNPSEIRDACFYLGAFTNANKEEAYKVAKEIAEIIKSYKNE